MYSLADRSPNKICFVVIWGDYCSGCSSSVGIHHSLKIKSSREFQRTKFDFFHLDWRFEVSSFLIKVMSFYNGCLKFSAGQVIRSWAPETRVRASNHSATTAHSQTSLGTTTSSHSSHHQILSSQNTLLLLFLTTNTLPGLSNTIWALSLLIDW